MIEQYETFDEAPTSGECSYSEKSFTKFCYFGIVGSKSWDLTHVIVIGHCLRIYDSELTFNNTPENFVYQLELTRKHIPSMIYSKNYSKDPTNEIIIYYCYLLKDNGFWGPTKLLKIGNTNRGIIENLVFDIKRATKHSI